jgi:hypothetical protein
VVEANHWQNPCGNGLNRASRPEHHRPGVNEGIPKEDDLNMRMPRHLHWIDLFYPRLDGKAKEKRGGEGKIKPVFRLVDT